MPPFGRLREIDPRHGWPHEARDFTPWLGQSENLALLGETLGMELELVEVEKPVGRYSADLVCRDAATDGLVVIENQLERTDHSHLGQILTYAAGLQAVTIVWIAVEFNEEHQAAVTWINEHTDDRVRFFGLEIELWQIGESPLAPKFNVVARPNLWVKSGTATRSAATSPVKLGQGEYWDGFVEWMRQRLGDRAIPCTPSPNQWLRLVSLGLSGIWTNLRVHTIFHHISAELYLDGPRAKDRFDFLERHKDEIESVFGGPLDWDRCDGSLASRIRAIDEDVDWQDRSDRGRQYEWLYSHHQRLVEAMSGPMAQLKQLEAARSR